MITREHSARVLGYHDRLAGDVRPPPAYWSFAECRAYVDGIAAAEERLAQAPAQVTITAPAQRGRRDIDEKRQ